MLFGVFLRIERKALLLRLEGVATEADQDALF